MTRHKRRHRSSRQPGAEEFAVPFWKDETGVSPIVFILACAVFVGGLLLGGSGGSFGDTLVQLFAVPLIALAAIQWARGPLLGPDRLALAILAGIVVLAIMQLAPLPISLWSALPARADLLRDAQSVGAAPIWHSLSLNPLATERALQWTLPAIAMFLAVRWMSARQRHVLLLGLFVSALALVALTVVQNSSSQEDVLATANEAIAKAVLALNMGQSAPPPRPDQHLLVGLFSNHNHFATFLAMTIPLVAASGLRIWLDRTKGQQRALFTLAAFLALVIMGLLTATIRTHSRAALILGALSLIGSFALLRNLRLNRHLLWAIAGLTVVGALAAFEMSASNTLGRLDNSVGIDMRWKIHATTLDAARHFGPLGSGLGTFVQAYEQVVPEKDLGPAYINRAHSDYHELWLETGLPGAVLIAGFIAWFAWCSARAWSGDKKPSTQRLLARAATVSILMVLLHSYVDYPLRKTAILVAFGMACGMLASVRKAETSGHGAKSGREIADRSTHARPIEEHVANA